MNALTQTVKNFWNDEEGVTAIEYSLIAALIAVAIIAAVTEVGTAVQSVFTRISTALDGVAI